MKNPVITSNMTKDAPNTSAVNSIQSNSSPATVTWSGIYKQAYEEIFKRQPNWKQAVIKENLNPDDRVISEFGHEVSLRAEEIAEKLAPVGKQKPVDKA